MLSDPSSVIQGPCGTAEGLMAVLAEVSPSAVGGGVAVPDDMASMAARAFIRLDVEQGPYSQELLLPFLFPSHRRILGVCKNHTRLPGFPEPCQTGVAKHVSGTASEVFMLSGSILSLFSFINT